MILFKFCIILYLGLDSAFFCKVKSNLLKKDFVTKDPFVNIFFAEFCRNTGFPIFHSRIYIFSKPKSDAKTDGSVVAF